MTAVDRTNLNSAPYTSVYSYIDNRTNINDPRTSRGNNNRKFVYDSDPNLMSLDFSRFPLVICNVPTKEVPIKSADSTVEIIEWTQRVEVHALKEGSGRNREDLGTSDILTISDQLEYSLKSSKFRSHLMDSNLYLKDVKVVSMMTPVITDQQMIYETVYEIRYLTRVRVADLG